MNVKVFTLLVPFLLVFVDAEALLNGATLNELGGQVEQEALPLPDILQLTPDWTDHLSRDGNSVKTILTPLLDQISDLSGQLNDQSLEEQVLAQIDELKNLFDHLILLKSQTFPPPKKTWIAQDQYSLEDFLKVHERFHNLEIEIENKKQAESTLTASINDLREQQNQLFTVYLQIPLNSPKKFLSGMQLLIIGFQKAVLREETRINNEHLKNDQTLLNRSQEELEWIENKASLTVDESAFQSKKMNAETALLILNKEEERFKSERPPSLDDKSRSDWLQNRKSILLNYDLKKELLLAEITLYDTGLLLGEIHKDSQDVGLLQKWKEIQLSVNAIQSNLKAYKNQSSLETKQIEHLPNQGSSEMSNDKLQHMLSNRSLIDAIEQLTLEINSVMGLIQPLLVKETSLLTQTRYNISLIWESITRFFKNWFGYPLFYLGDTAISFLDIIKALLIVLLSVVISKMVNKGIKSFSTGQDKRIETTLYAFRRIIYYLIVFLGLLFALGALGITMRNIAIVLGALGIGIGFGLQNIANNFLSGLTILAEGNVRIGDYVQLASGPSGKITEINVQKTTIHSFDGQDLLVPNSQIAEQQVINWTKNDPFYRIHIPFSVAYGTDTDLVCQVVSEAAYKVKATLTEKQGMSEPEVWLSRFGDSSLDYELVVWVNMFKSRGIRALTAIYLKEIEQALKQHLIHIPFPQRDLYVKEFPKIVISGESHESK